MLLQVVDPQPVHATDGLALIAYDTGSHGGSSGPMRAKQSHFGLTSLALTSEAVQS